jgi:hypothetical protein
MIPAFVPWLWLLAALPGQDDPEQLSAQLVEVRRLYIDKFGGGEAAAHLRDMIIAAIQKTRLFVLTENPDKADAILRGSAEDLIFTDTFQTSEGVQARTGVTGGQSRSTRDRDYFGITSAVGDQESSRIAERKHEASASVRIVNRDGDVVWSTLQESQGAKFKSASADVAERIAKQLQQDVQKLKAARSGASAPPPPAPK